MKKLNFEQMELVNGGQTMVSATNVEIENEITIRPCVVGKWVVGCGLILLGFGVPFASPAAAVGFGIIAGATTIFC
jgi:hypothetical protein